MHDAQQAAQAFQATFGPLLGSLRPKLHRYCARMTGSVIDGEDVLQEALAKAIEALPAVTPLANAEGWLFRIAHNSALDFLRRRARIAAREIAEEEPDLEADQLSDPERREMAAAGLRTFMRLPIRERGAVVLMDVLGYSLREIGAVTDMSVPTVKALLHRGRARLRSFAAEAEDRPLPVLAPEERERLAFYVDRFNARDFDALRDRLADDVKAELVGEVVMRGRREVSTYFGNYARTPRLRMTPGMVEGRPAVLVFEDASTQPAYFVLPRWADGHIAGIRDFRYARYVTEGADIRLLDIAPSHDV